MYDESSYFDVTHDPNPVLLLEDTVCGHSSFNLEELSHLTHHSSMAPDALHSLVGSFEMDQDLHSHLIQQDPPPPILDHSNWVDAAMQACSQDPIMQQCYEPAAVSYTDPLAAYNNMGGATTAPDLLSLLQLPRCGVVAPQESPATNFPLDVFGGDISVLPADDGGPVLYDPSAMTTNLGYPGASTQSHLLRDLFNSLPQNYGLFCGVDEREGGEVLAGVFRQEDQDGGKFESPVFDYRRGLKGEKGSFATEKQRREQMNCKFMALKLLIPNSGKDRASIVMDAIDFIKELQRTVGELKIMVEKKRQGRSKRLKTTDETAATEEENPSTTKLPANEHVDPAAFSDALRSSWLQRRSREAFVDVRIVEDEVNIKLTQKKMANCLLLASRVLDELRLDIAHVSGGFIGDHYIFMFNAKISEGSTVYASAIAKKLLEAMERQCPIL